MAVDFGYKTAWDLEGLEPNTFFPVPASVVFARKIGENATATPLAGEVERWLGKAGHNANRETHISITDTSAASVSPYAAYTREGATVVPRCLFFVEETENTAIIQAGQTVTVNPRRGSWDKEPWRSLDLTAITEQTIDAQHAFDIHLGETLVPYATLSSLKAALPLRRGDAGLPTDVNGPGGVRLGGLAHRMRSRWQTVSSLWQKNRAVANKMDLLGQLDYYGKLSSQLEWQQNKGGRPVRVVYNQSGAPTASLLHADAALIDYTLFWVTCKDAQEANFLLATINSDALALMVNKYTTPNWAGNTRHLHKHLWKLPIPEFDPGNSLHAAVSKAGEIAAEGAAQRLAQLRQERDRVTVTVARRELRKWLRESAEGQEVETNVKALLS